MKLYKWARCDGEQSGLEYNPNKHVLKVETDGSHDILIGGKTSVDDMGIVDNVSAEQQATTCSVDQVHGLAERDEDADEACHHC